MKKPRWVIQNNLISENDLNELQKTCDSLNITYIEVQIIPFDKKFPEIPIDDVHENIYYGSTTFMNNVYDQLHAPKGLFYNLESFSMENYLSRWGKYMLNFDAVVTTIGGLSSIKYNPDDNIFIRPDGDGKEFDGQVSKFKDINVWMNRVMQYDDVDLTSDSKILVGPAYNLKREWRNYIVNGKVITSSRYRNNFKLSKSGTDIPEDMIKFVEKRCKEYTPHDVFAMDIAEAVDDGKTYYYIIECGCMNSVGFYHCDIHKYVESLSRYIANF